jgi:hypothetical protein
VELWQVREERNVKPGAGVRDEGGLRAVAPWYPAVKSASERSAPNRVTPARFELLKFARFIDPAL